MYGQVGRLFSERWAKKEEGSEVSGGGDMGGGGVFCFDFFEVPLELDLWWLHLLRFLCFCLVD